MLLFLSFEPISLTKTDSHLQNHPPRRGFWHTHSPDHSHPAPLRHDHLIQNHTISHPLAHQHLPRPAPPVSARKRTHHRPSNICHLLPRSEHRIHRRRLPLNLAKRMVLLSLARNYGLRLLPHRRAGIRPPPVDDPLLRTE